MSNPPPQVTVTVQKPADDSAIGLSLNYYDGGKIVARCILDDGLFHGSSLKAGFVLVSVNETPVKGLSTAQAMQLFLDAPAGDLTVVAEDVGLRITSFVKEASNTKVGIGLKERNGSIIISNIAEDGVMAGTDIQVGQRLLGVNGVPCQGLTSKEAISLFKELDAITVMTEDIGLTSVTVKKESPDTKIGIGIKSINGFLVISSIAEDGLFGGTALKVAQKLVSVNSKYCDNLTKQEAIQLFKDAESTIVVVTEDAHLISVTAHKESVDTKLGLALADLNEFAVITSVAEDSPFAGTALVPGLRILCVNNTLCKGLSKQEVVDVLKRTAGDVTIIAEKVGYITAVAVKQSPDDKIGIGLKDMTGNIIVSSIAENSLFVNSELKVGHRVISINKMSVMGMDKYQAIKLFQTADSTITVMAEDVGLVGATVVKPSVDAKVGIGLKERNGDLYISSIYDSGLFTTTDLKEDMKLLSVNRRSVKGMGREDAIKLFRDADGEVSVIAQAL
jgi:C-terminal processing protease CtpA/Prc